MSVGGRPPTPRGSSRNWLLSGPADAQEDGLGAEAAFAALPPGGDDCRVPTGCGDVFGEADRLVRGRQGRGRRRPTLPGPGWSSGDRVGGVHRGVGCDLHVVGDAAFVQRGPDLAGISVAGVRGQQRRPQPLRGKRPASRPPASTSDGDPPLPQSSVGAGAAAPPLSPPRRPPSQQLPDRQALVRPLPVHWPMSRAAWLSPPGLQPVLASLRPTTLAGIPANASRRCRLAAECTPRLGPVQQSSDSQASSDPWYFRCALLAFP